MVKMLKMLQTGQTSFDSYLNELGKYYRGDSRYKRLRNGQIAAVQDFQEPYPTPASTESLVLAFMELLNRYVYPQIQGRAKFTLQFKLKTDDDITDITLTKAIMLTYADGTLIPKELIFQEIYKAVMAQAENYGVSEVLAVCVRSYSDGCLDMNLVRFPTKEESDLSIKNTFYKYYQINNLKNASWSKNQTKKARYNTYITKDTQVLKNKTKFMVADLETIPYKIGENDENKRHSERKACGLRSPE
jgi:hypothetical protein